MRPVPFDDARVDRESCCNSCGLAVYRHAWDTWQFTACLGQRQFTVMPGHMAVYRHAWDTWQFTVMPGTHG
eukprot:328059-Alexandrium_andersonii.AAC.1